MTRRTATLIWAALVATPLLFMALAFELAKQPALPQLTAPLFWGSIAASALNVTLSRLLPPRLGPARAGEREAVAFTRLVVSFALCDAAALAPLVAYLLTRDPRLLGILAVDLLALVVLYPSDGRWDSLMPDPRVGSPGKMER